MVGLIALLIGILLPALAAARKHAQTVECATRIRQLTVAAEIYANENDGFYPPRNGGDSTMNTFAAADGLGPGPVVALSASGDGGRYDQILLPPLRQARKSIWPVAFSNNLRQIAITMAHYESDQVAYLPDYVCPSDENPTPPMTSTERFTPWSSSFVFNGFNDFKIGREFQESWRPTDVTAMRRDEIKLASEMALFGEKRSGPTFARLYADIYASTAHHPGTILDQTRHQGGFSNVGFADGSTRTFAPPGTISPQNLWAVRDENRSAPKRYTPPRRD